jgi:uncharacterized protein YcaQ
MATDRLPQPTLTLTPTEARRFLLAHQHLWPPRRLRGPDGIVQFVRHVGCIQYDPIQVAGGNPHLVLQSRVAGYRAEWLDQLLYAERQLCDGWDKVASIYLATDWPYFHRRRDRMRWLHAERDRPPAHIVAEVHDTIRERGPLSAIDLKKGSHGETMDWWWGMPTRVGRAALEVLYDRGDLGVHHRVGTRRYFDLVQRLLPDEVVSVPEPNPTSREYQEWHVLRRVGGLGLALPTASDYWIGILGVKTPQRRAILARLEARGDLVAVAVEGLDGRTFFLRRADLPTLEAVRTAEPSEPQAAILAPLDNLLWDRALVRFVFDFDYVWEVYKPAAQRRYGYYVLPVLYGDRFVARFDPAVDKDTSDLIVQNWWWEPDVEPDGGMVRALAECFGGFLAYLGAGRVRLAESVAGEPSLAWLSSVSGGGQ